MCFPHFESRAKLCKVAEGMDGQMEKKCAFNGWREERGASGGEVRRGSGGRGRGEHVEQCQNHTHICCSSQMFPISFKCFLQSWESVQRGWGPVGRFVPFFVSTLK